MAGWTIQLDPPAVSSGRAMLDLNNGPIQVGTDGSGGLGIDWGQAAITAYESQQGQWGNSVSDYIFPNRTVTINLILGGTGYEDDEETVRTQLAQKVALLQREGGQILRQREGGAAMYADIVNASLTIPDLYGETGEIEPDVVLTLELLPDFYGATVTLDAIHSTGICEAVLTQSGSPAMIEGDYPARCQIALTDTSGQNQDGVIWGFRSRCYSSASTAALFYEAEAMTPLNGAAVASLSGASGGSVVQQTSLPSDTWVPILSTTLESGSAQLTHSGTYQVWVRCYSASANPMLRLYWAVGSLAAPVANDPVQLPNANEFTLVSLGTIRLDPAPIGSYNWQGVIQAYAAVADSPIAIDCLYLQPLDDTAGQATALGAEPVTLLSNSAYPTTAANSSAVGTVAWVDPTAVEQFGEGNAASITLSGGAGSYYLLAEDFQFSIPSTATIQGIVVQLPVRASPPLTIGIAGLHLIRAGTVQAPGKSDATGWPASEQLFQYGSPSDLWGASWTPSDINNGGFGVALEAFGYSGTGYLDVVGVVVYYTLPGGFTVASDVVLAAAGQAQLRTDGMYRQDPSGSAYAPMSKVAGDLPRLPASGMEEREAQLMLKPSRGNLTSTADGGVDAFTVTVSYQPCWLSRP